MDGRVRVGVQPGDGIVARFTGVAVVIGPGHDSFTDPLLDLVARPGGPEDLLWQVVALVSGQRPDVPPFALVVEGEEALTVLRYGAARVLVDGTASGPDVPLTWREEPVPAGARTVALAVVDGPVEPHPHTNLGQGVSRGTGLVLELGTTTAVRTVPTPTPTPPAEPAAPAAPPVEEAPAAFAPVTPGPAPAHASTPTPAPSETGPVPVPPPPPTDDDPGDTVYLTADLLALESRDGRRIPLDRNYVIGRNPRLDPSVAVGAASPVQVPVEDNLVSRVHAFVDIHGGTVMVRDGGSANGTHFARPGEQAWTRLGEEPVPISLGWSVRIGRQVYTVVKNPSA